MRVELTASYLRDARPVEVIKDGKCHIGRLVCAACGGKDEVVLGNRPPPEGLRKNFQNKGWDLRRRPTCPECGTKRKAENMSANVTPIKNTEASDAAKKVKRLIYMALEDYYDDTKKAYRDGHSDKSIADELGASEKFVATIRESDFGPLSEPDEFRELRGEVSKLASEVGKLQTKILETAKRNGWS